MSKFAIYRAETDPRRIGISNRRMYTVFVFLGILISIIINIRFDFKGSLSVITDIFLIAVSGLMILLFIRMKRQSRKLKKIGTLEFTRNAIRKKIGDLYEVHLYDEIIRIELEKHLRAFSVIESRTGAITYIIKIIKKDSTTDHFIISDRSVDFSKKIEITDTLKVLKSSAGLQIVLTDRSQHARENTMLLQNK